MTQSLYFERFYPSLFAIVTGIGAWLMDLSLPENATRELLTAVISFGAILAGFLGTAQSILVTLSPALLSKLRSSSYMDDLSGYLTQALIGNLMISVLSVVGFFDFPDIKPYYPPFWAATFVYAFISFWRVNRIVLLLLRIDPDNL